MQYLILILTDKSLNGWINIPSGSLALFNKLEVWGIAVNVHRNTLKPNTKTFHFFFKSFIVILKYTHSRDLCKSILRLTYSAWQLTFLNSLLSLGFTTSNPSGGRRFFSFNRFTTLSCKNNQKIKVFIISMPIHKKISTQSHKYKFEWNFLTCDCK